MRLPHTISRRGLRELIRKELAETGFAQNVLARRLGLTDSAMSRAMNHVDAPASSWLKIAAHFGYAPTSQDHLYTHTYVRIPVEQMREAA